MGERRASASGSPAWPAPPLPRRRGAGAHSFQWAWRAALPLSLITVAAVVALLSTTLDARGRLAFFAFASATVLWSTTRLDAAFVGLSAIMFLVVTGAAPQEALTGALASDVIWLLIGAFVLAAALRTSGLADRLAWFCLRRARTVGGAFWALTAALIPLAFVMPSTSGRAAMVLPVFQSATTSVRNPRVQRALALLIPVVVLTSTSTTLIAAASHLIVNDLLGQHGERSLSFARWALYGIPYGVASSLVACAGILRVLVGRKDRRAPFDASHHPRRPFDRRQAFVLVVTFAMVALWLTSGVHGLGTATVAMAGALVLSLPRVGCLSWKDGVRSISWSLVLFIASALVLGRLLLDSGVAAWLVRGLLHASPMGSGASEAWIVISLSLVALTAHLYMPSHSARAAVLMPPLFMLVTPLGLNVTAVAFVATMGSNYCLTFPVSSKALQLYQEVEPRGFEAGELLRVGAVLLPLHLLLIVAFYFGYWKWVGLSL